MNNREFTDVTFNAALARARAAEAAELRAAAAGAVSASVDVGEYLRKQAADHNARVLAQHFGH